MGVDWKSVPMVEAPLEIIDGDRGKNYPSRQDQYQDGYCLFLNAGNVTDEGFNFSSNVFITKERDDLLRQGKLERNDIVITTRGTVGNVAFYDSKIPFDHVRINSGMVIIRTNKDGLDPKFAYYFLKSKLFSNQVQMFRTGSAQPQLPIKDINQIELPLPPLPTQHRIADILGTLDDKIALNREMNRTLEAMARAIFKSWFVDFDPVYSKMEGHGYPLPAEVMDLFPDELVESELGLIPKGWEICPLDNVIKVNDINITKNYDQEEIQYINISSVSEGVVNEIENLHLEDAPSRAKRLVKHGDVIWSSVRPNRKSYALISHPPENLVVSTGFAVLTPIQIPSSFLYSLVTRNDFVNYLVAHSIGSAYPAVVPDVFKIYPFVLPSIRLLDQFERRISYFFEKMHSNTIQITSLENIRDTLLPRLMSGEIGV